MVWVWWEELRTKHRVIPATVRPGKKRKPALRLPLRTIRWNAAAFSTIRNCLALMVPARIVTASSWRVIFRWGLLPVCSVTISFGPSLFQGSSATLAEASSLFCFLYCTASPNLVCFPILVPNTRHRRSPPWEKANSWLGMGLKGSLL